MTISPTSPETAPEPDSFKDVLRLILDSNPAIGAVHARRLGIPHDTLSGIIHGHQKTTQRYVDKFRVGLEEYYGQGLAQHRATFDRFYSQLNPYSAYKLKKPPRAKIKPQKQELTEAEWRKAAGEFVGKLMEERGHDIDALPNAGRRSVIQDREIWRSVIAGKEETLLSSYILALREIRGPIYRLEPQTPHYKKAKRLIAQGKKLMR